MKWEKEALKRVSNAPFFIRPRIKGIIESQARLDGKDVITAEDVAKARIYFLKKGSKGDKDVQHEKSVNLYKINACKGENKDCPYMVQAADRIISLIDNLMKRLDFNNRRSAVLEGMILPHNLLKISISSCPNGCSMPYIADIGIIAQAKPLSIQDKCSGCMLCVKACKENAVAVNRDNLSHMPDIDYRKCMYCGVCVKSCKTQALVNDMTGFKLLAGGKMGRHPRLAKEILGWCRDDELLKKVEELVCIFLEKASQDDKMADLI